jgi:DMSO/TMAO reductase YedYZ molybdopterin-dependent catalytic subunit
MVRAPDPLVTRFRFTSALRSPRLTSQLGLTLAVAFAVCFLTGYVSHAIQHPPWWFAWPTRPVNLYRITQGLHVATGIALVPLVSAKLWSVYPRLFTWPPIRDAAHAIERASVAVLVSAALFEVVTGLLNIALWYAPMPFFFPAAHYWTAYLVTGAILVHVAVKLPIVRDALRRRSTVDTRMPVGLTRRGLLGTVAATAGLLTVATVGQTIRPLAGLSVLAPRDPRLGPQGLPVNKSATGAGVRAAATDPGYRLTVVGPAGALRLSLVDLAGFDQHTAALPISCVEGWSADAVWSGVRVRDLVAAAGCDGDSPVLVESLQAGGRYRASVLTPAQARDPLALLAIRLGGEPLHLDHGYPCRLIAPNRPGVLQTKWVARLTIGGDGS